MSHWAQAYLGLPHDDTEHHCWAFCRRIWRERFGLDVPEMPMDAGHPRAVRRAFEESPERAAWVPATHPQEGDAVLMAMGRWPCHVGIWIDLGGVLHSIEGGSVWTPKARLGDLGYRIVGVYRRAG